MIFRGNCDQCDTPFVSSQKLRRFCSVGCRGAHRLASYPEPEGTRTALYTLAEVAAALGLSTSRVDQIEKSALRKLRAQTWLREHLTP